MGAFYRPLDVATTNRYIVYSALLLEGDKRTNANVFLTKRKILNTVCGLDKNTDQPAKASVPASQCTAGKCFAVIDGVVTGKPYVFNVVAELIACTVVFVLLIYGLMLMVYG